MRSKIGKITVVKIMVKEYEGADLQNKLYSIEAVGVDLKASHPSVGEREEADSIRC